MAITVVRQVTLLIQLISSLLQLQGRISRIEKKAYQFLHRRLAFRQFYITVSTGTEVSLVMSIIDIDVNPYW